MSDTEKVVGIGDTYAMLYGLMVELADLPYEQYPNIHYELLQLLDIFALEHHKNIYWLAMREGLLSWQQKDADEVMTRLKERFAPQIEQYKRGEVKVLGFLIGQLVKEGCDPTEAKSVWLKELEKES